MIRTDHRPWPIPAHPWRMKQTWSQVLFAHWPVDAKELRSVIPHPLQLDLYDGQAWIGIVPFKMSGVQLRLLPGMPMTPKFPELNVRTYVTINQIPGVYFFSLDATNLLTILGARLLYHLPYYFSKMNIQQKNETIHYYNRRRFSNKPFQFSATYQPISAPYEAKPETLDHWLTERYCLYSHHKGRIYRCDILHEPWKLHLAEANIERNTMMDIEGVKPLTKEPLLHYAERMDVLTWGLERVTVSASPHGAKNQS